MIRSALYDRARWGGYGRGDVAGDVFGGVISAAVMMPLVLAWGVASGLGAIAGLSGGDAAEATRRPAPLP